MHKCRGLAVSDQTIVQLRHLFTRALADGTSRAGRPLLTGNIRAILEPSPRIVSRSTSRLRNNVCTALRRLMTRIQTLWITGLTLFSAVAATAVATLEERGALSDAWARDRVALAGLEDGLVDHLHAHRLDRISRSLDRLRAREPMLLGLALCPLDPSKHVHAFPAGVGYEDLCDSAPLRELLSQDWTRRRKTNTASRTSSFRTFSR